MRRLFTFLAMVLLVSSLGLSTVTRTGTPTLLQSSTDPDSGACTVPADCTLVVAYFGYYGTVNRVISACDINSVAFTHVITQSDNTGYGYTSIWYLINPATGAQTFSWDWDGAVTTGANIYLVYYKGVNTASPIRGSGFAANAANPSESSSFNTAVGDLIQLVVYSGDGADAQADPADKGQTEILDSGVYNASEIAIGEKAGTSGTTTTWSSGEYDSHCAISITVAAASSYIPTIIITEESYKDK